MMKKMEEDFDLERVSMQERLEDEVVRDEISAANKDLLRSVMIASKFMDKIPQKRYTLANNTLHRHLFKVESYFHLLQHYLSSPTSCVLQFCLTIITPAHLVYTRSLEWKIQFRL